MLDLQRTVGAVTRRGYLIAACFALAIASTGLAFSIVAFRNVQRACYPTIVPPGSAIATQREQARS